MVGWGRHSIGNQSVCCLSSIPIGRCLGGKSEENGIESERNDLVSNCFWAGIEDVYLNFFVIKEK